MGTENAVDDATAKRRALMTGVAAEEPRSYKHTHTHTQIKLNIASGPCDRIYRSIYFTQVTKKLTFIS